MKESFVIYKSFYEPIKFLNNEQMGELFRAIFEYQIDGLDAEINPEIKMAFEFFKNQFRLDDEKYQVVVDRNKANGAKGGRPRKPKKPSGLNGNPKNPSEPKKADNENEKDNENDNEKDNDLIECEIVEENHFDTFWKQYPKKKSKAQAEKAFAKAIKLTSIEVILSSLENHKLTHDWKKQDGQFIPYPASWLNAKGWENELELAEVGISSGMQEYLHLLNQRGEI